GERGLEPLVAGLATRPRHRLVERVGGEDAEHHRYPGVELRPHQPGRALPCHLLVVAGLAADHRAQGDDGVVLTRLRRPQAHQRELERPGTQLTLTYASWTPVLRRSSRVP